ncbi:MAG: dihydrodipicolinate synthase family protein [candidate division NC10 bacterium]|nr:dihydrodipicolinate synthase family protein [candidate division NC10 bacterium]
MKRGRGETVDRRGGTGKGWSWETALCGVVPPMISPLTISGDPDGPAIGGLVEHILGGGCNGLFLGIKDSAGSFEAFQQFLAVKQARPTFRVLPGDESLGAASLLLGADGLVPGMANFAPRLFVSLREAAAKGDAATCADLQRQITNLATLHGHGHWLPALKAACALVGLGNGRPSPPLAPAGDEDRQAIESILRRHGVLRPPFSEG